MIVKSKILLNIHLLPLLVFITLTYITNLFMNLNNAIEIFCFVLFILSFVLCLKRSNKIKFVGALLGCLVFLLVVYDLYRINQLILFKHWTFLSALIIYILTGCILVIKYFKPEENSQ